ncbi:hypothetical protein GALL_243320 [mine drainage metagenome]|uniref:Uncharacterized protein n=1 Tax=mine drainage metagenome TaxID=410659 RepID=A0A1J5RNT8_9ZZZZ
MTILNATLTADSLTVSQDMAHCHPGGTLVEYAPKVITRPNRRMVAASAGNSAFAVELAATLDTLPRLDLDQIAAGLRNLHGAHAEQVVIVGWWEELLGLPLAYVFQAEGGFAPQQIQPGAGHVISPAEALFEDRAAMLVMSVAATQGQDVEGFHVALALAQREAARRGLIDKPGWGSQSIGGKLTIARLDRNGVHRRNLDIFGDQIASHKHNTAGDVLAARWALHPAAAA